MTITGPNDFARHQELVAVVTAFGRKHGDMAVERLDGEEASADRLRESVESLPFLTARKLIVLREPGKQKAFAENIADILQAVAETNDVIIVEPKLDKRSSYYKTLRKQTDFREFGELDAGQLARWAATYAREQGGTLSPSDAKLLIDRIGPNQQLLKSELDKLLQFDPAIATQSIRLLTEPTPQSTVFELLEAAFSGQPARALQLYREQRAMKVEPLAILAMLAWQLHILAVVKVAAARTPEETARAAKLSPFVVRKSQGLAREHDLAQLKRQIADLLAIDLQLKTSAIDADEALQHYLLTLSAK